METRNSGKAVTALVCGIMGLFIPIFGIILSILGIIFGGVARSEIHRSTHKLTGEGMAIAGMVCGIIGVVVWGVVWWLGISIFT